MVTETLQKLELLWLLRNEKKFWTGPDIAVAGDTLVVPNQNFSYHEVITRGEPRPEIPANETRVLLTRDHLPRALTKNRLPPECVGMLGKTMRSVLAQLGLSVGGLTGDNRDLALSPGDWSRLLDGDTAEATVHIDNSTPRTFELPAGTPLFRLWAPFFSQPLGERDIERALAAGTISISGRRGQDWDVSPREPLLDEPPGIWFALDPDYRRYLPPDSSSAPLRVESRPDYRAWIDSLLVPVPELPEPLLWIGQTSSTVTLGSGITGEFSPRAGNGVQRESRIADPEKTRWQLRTEILSATTPGLMPEFTSIHFWGNR